MSLYCEKLEHCLGSVRVCLARAAGLVSSYKKCQGCSFLGHLKRFDGERYQTCPSLYATWVEELTDMGILFDRNGRVIRAGVRVRIDGRKDLCKVRKVYHEPFDSSESKVGVYLPDGRKRRYPAYKTVVFSRVKTWKPGALVQSRANSAVRGMVLRVWYADDSAGTVWVVVRTEIGDQVESPDLLKAYEGPPSALHIDLTLPE